MTGQASEVAEQKTRERGAVAFFEKLLKADALIVTIRGVLGKKLVPVRYLGDGIAGEGMIEDLSLSGSYLTGNAPVSVGMVLALQPKVVERITQVISTLVKTQHGSSRKG